MLGRLLTGAAIAWPLVAGGALWQRALPAGASGPGGGAEPVWATVVYAAASRICHQRPERSFHTHNVAWPVCARCAGLYLAAPLAAFAALAAFRRRSPNPSRLQPLRLVALAAIPTALTLAWEWGGLGTPSNVVRFMTALPLGAAITFVLIATVSEHQASNSIG
jgi:uncharacterized membrane protein